MKGCAIRDEIEVPPGFLTFPSSKSTQKGGSPLLEVPSFPLLKRTGRGFPRETDGTFGSSVFHLVCPSLISPPPHPRDQLEQSFQPQRQLLLSCCGSWGQLGAWGVVEVV